MLGLKGEIIIKILNVSGRSDPIIIGDICGKSMKGRMENGTW